MKVYHGGTQRIERPLVHLGRAGLDFGQGFYGQLNAVGDGFKIFVTASTQQSAVYPSAESD